MSHCPTRLSRWKFKVSDAPAIQPEKYPHIRAIWRHSVPGHRQLLRRERNHNDSLV
jgi:hypothetical protein